MTDRPVIITANTILAIFKDYMAAEDLPADATLVTMMYKPTEQGKLAIVVEADSIPSGAEPLQVHFDIRRLYSVGGAH
jgi:hypothetical protein